MRKAEIFDVGSRSVELDALKFGAPRRKSAEANLDIGDWVSWRGARRRSSGVLRLSVLVLPAFAAGALTYFVTQYFIGP